MKSPVDGSYARNRDLSTRAVSNTSMRWFVAVVLSLATFLKVKLLALRALACRASVYVWHAIICTGVLALILTSYWAVSYGVSVYKRHRTERLLQQLASLHVGTGDSQRARQIARDFGGTEHCATDLCTYDFEEHFAYSDSRLLHALYRTEWDHFGLRPWEVSAHIAIHNGQLSEMSFMVLVGRGRGWLYNEGLLSGNMWAWLVASIRSGTQSFERRRQAEQEYARRYAVKSGNRIEAGNNGIIVKKPNLTISGGGESLEILLSPNAPAESRAIAFDVNLRCTTAMWPCTELCQLTPRAWQAYSQYQKSNGWYIQELDCSN